MNLVDNLWKVQAKKVNYESAIESARMVTYCFQEVYYW